MNDYIKIETASELAKISVQALYRGIKRGMLKSARIKGKIYTKKEWVNDYVKNRNNRQAVHLQGKPIFDYLNGDWSVRMAAKYLSTSVQAVHCLLRYGHIHSTRRGCYHVIRKESVDYMLETRGYVRHVRTRKAA